MCTAQNKVCTIVAPGEDMCFTKDFSRGRWQDQEGDDGPENWVCSQLRLKKTPQEGGRVELKIRTGATP